MISQNCFYTSLAAYIPFDRYSILMTLSLSWWHYLLQHYHCPEDTIIVLVTLTLSGDTHCPSDITIILMTLTLSWWHYPCPDDANIVLMTLSFSWWHYPCPNDTIFALMILSLSWWHYPCPDDAVLVVAGRHVVLTVPSVTRIGMDIQILKSER